MIKLTGKVVPQYDNDGWDTGLWLVFATDTIREEHVATPLYENVELRINGEQLQVRQLDWDGESYDEYGCPVGEYTDLGTLECRNPYDPLGIDPEPAGTLLEWLENHPKAAPVI